MKRLLFLLALAVAGSIAQPLTVCVLTGTQTTGYVLTATDGTTGCSWQTVGAASVDANTVKNAVFLNDTGTANAVAGTTATTFPASYATGQCVSFLANATNTSSTTININSIGAKNLTKRGSTALAAGNKVSGNSYFACYDGTEFQLLEYTIIAADVPTLNQNTTGNAATATALASAPSLCTTGQAPTGILASGNATGCASIGGGGGGANANGYYWVSQSTNAPVNGVNIGALSTALLKILVSGSVATPASAVADTDYAAAPGACVITVSSGTATWPNASTGNGSGGPCNLYTLILTANVTANSPSTVPAGLVTNKTYQLQLTQNSTGGYTFAYPSNLLGACAVSPTLSVTTTIEAIYDGTNLNAVSCTTSDTPTLISGPVRSAPGTPASGLSAWFDSTGLNFQTKNTSAAISGTAFAASATSHQWINSFTPGTGVFTLTQPAFTDISGTATAAQIPAALSSTTSVNGTTIPSGGVTLTQTVASGTVSLGTTAVSANSCSSAITATATGTATTDAIIATANADPSGVTGYSPSSSGAFFIWAYPTSGTVNFKLCNNTSSSITPGSAVTLNWRVVR